MDEVQKNKQSWKIWSQESKKKGSSEQKCPSGRDLSTLPLSILVSKILRSHILPNQCP